MSLDSSNDKSVRNSTSTSIEFTPFSRAECIKYIIFLVIFTTMVVLGRGLGSSNYYVSEGVTRSMTETYFIPSAPLGLTAAEKNLMEIDQYFEIYDYIDQVIIPNVLNDKNPADQEITNSWEKQLTAGQNKVIGAIRIRQLRVKEETCLQVQSDWTCYPGWSSKKESTIDTPSGITWQSESDNDESVTFFGVRTAYPGSGYVVDLPLNKSESITEVNRLRSTGFIDRATRFIVTDFLLYNPTLNLHCIVRIAFELAAAGGVVPTYEIKTWRFYRYEETRGLVLFIFEILFVLFVVYFTFEEIYEFITKPWVKYKSDKWNFVDVVNLIFFYMTIIWRIYEYTTMHKYNLMPPDGIYSNLRDLAVAFTYESYMSSVNGFLLYLKLFKYLTFSKRVKFLFIMLHRSSNDLFIFSIVLLVVFLAFAMMGFLAFSSDVNDFRSFPHSVVNLLRYSVAEAPYDELTNSNKALGSFYFVVWGLIMLLILANVFIAILSDAYSEVIHEMQEHEDEALLTALFQGTLVDRFLKKIKSFRKADENKDGIVDTDELANAMSINRAAAKSMINRYDADGDGALDEDEYKHLARDPDQSQRDSVLSVSESAENVDASTLSRNQVVPETVASKLLNSQEPTRTVTNTIDGDKDQRQTKDAVLNERLDNIEALIGDFLSQVSDDNELVVEEEEKYQ